MILRKAAGVAVLVVLLAIGALLTPPYLKNWKLQRYVNGLVDDPGTAAIRTKLAAVGVTQGDPP